MSCGATALARKPSPREHARGGSGCEGSTLTPGELRVAQRAAAGHTNRDIVEDLVVTVETVEMYLANGYAKLRIRSRTQLPDALCATAESQG